ncbi:MAG: EF2563 family selenium-dependent molybdenum hydroxylase system protein [Selenomonadaceae bacterium]|nr:EF2563 family selenium-dependent molybdenum hydroxylase system protein [Selenomonadaceae bacterium]MBR4696106.1 EF2563 family selenium-dependent molybdenum hydroxylase system protein [Selenomonadaceae bacterium]
MKRLVIIRGGGELATAAAIYLHNSGFRVLVLEKPQPTSIRREVSFADAAYDGKKSIARVECRLADSPKEAEKRLKDEEVVMLIDPKGKCIPDFKPKVLMDGIMANENRGTSKGMAEHTIALGPGFCAGRDVDAVIETMRGHNLGKIIYEGYSYRDQGKASLVDVAGAFGRLIFAPEEGKFEGLYHISHKMQKDEPVARLHKEDGSVVEIRTQTSGVLRGIVHSGCTVKAGQKLVDINPVMSREDCFRISDKARCVAGSVLQAVMAWESKKRKRISFDF